MIDLQLVTMYWHIGSPILIYGYQVDISNNPVDAGKMNHPLSRLGAANLAVLENDTGASHITRHSRSNDISGGGHLVIKVHSYI